MNSSSDQAILKDLYYITPIGDQKEFLKAQQDDATRSKIHHLWRYGDAIMGTVFYPCTNIDPFKTHHTFQAGGRTIATQESMEACDGHGKKVKIMVHTMVLLTCFQNNAMETDENDAEDDMDDDDENDENVQDEVEDVEDEDGDVEDDDEEDANNDNIACDDQKQQQAMQANDNANSFSGDNDSVMNDVTNRWNAKSAAICARYDIIHGFNTGNIEFTPTAGAPSSTAGVPNIYNLPDEPHPLNDNANNNDNNLEINMNLHC